MVLHESLHRVPLHQVAQYLVHRTRLCARQLEGQALRESAEKSAVGAQHRRSAPAAVAIGKAQRQLLREQLVELHPPPRRMGAFAQQSGIDAGRRPVQEPQGLVERWQGITLAQLRRHGVVERPGVERFEHLDAQRGLRHAGGCGIDRRQRVGQRLVVGDDAVARMRHLDAEPAAADLAEGAHLATLLDRALELLQLAAVEVEEAKDDAIGMHDQLAPRPEGDFGALDARFNQHGRARRCAIGRRHPGLVLVAVRQVQHEVEARAQPELRERRALHPACRMASISTSAPRGSPATPMAARDG